MHVLAHGLNNNGHWYIRFILSYKSRYFSQNVFTDTKHVLYKVVMIPLSISNQLEFLTEKLFVLYEVGKENAHYDIVIIKH